MKNRKPHSGFGDGASRYFRSFNPPQELARVIKSVFDLDLGITLTNFGREVNKKMVQEMVHGVYLKKIAC